MAGRWFLFLRKRVNTLLGLLQLLLLRASALKMLAFVRRQKLTFLNPGALVDLALAAVEAERKNTAGLFIEAGTALGGSAILIASAKKTDRPMEVYDTFEMIPPPSIADGEDAHARYETIQAGQATGFGDQTYYGYQKNLYQQVERSFEQAGFPTAKNQIRLVKGLIENTMQINNPVALAHIDCDWYAPVLCCLQQIVPHLSAGGRIIIDDYNHWSGAKKAVDEYFQDQKELFVFQQRARLHIVKRK